MAPDSPWLIALLILGTIGLVVLAFRLASLTLQVTAVVGALVLSALSGIAAVNDFYGYYQSWGSLVADISGRPAAGLNVDQPNRPAGAGNTAAGAGKVVQLNITGPQTGITRPALVYLPPQYDDPAFANTKFPVVELMHGTPGGPLTWVNHMQLTQVADRLIAAHTVGPMIFVMPSINDPKVNLDCVSTPKIPNEAYLLTDVRAVIAQQYRVSTDPAQWGIAGYSSGGYCAVNMSLRNRASFGAAASMDGYFRAADGPAGTALAGDAAALAANTPLDVAGKLAPGTTPMPAFWLEAGTGNQGDDVAARAFAAALKGIAPVQMVIEPGAKHDVDAWNAALGPMLTWFWQQLAPPSLRVQWPMLGQSSSAAPSGQPSQSGQPNNS